MKSLLMLVVGSFLMSGAAHANPPTFVEGDFNLNGSLVNTSHHVTFDIDWAPSQLVEGPTPHVNSHTDDGSGDATYSYTYYTIRLLVGRIHVKIQDNSNSQVLLDYSYPLYMSGESYRGVDLYQAHFEAIDTSCLDGIAGGNAKFIQSSMLLGTNIDVSVAGINQHHVYTAESIRQVNFRRNDVVIGSGRYQESQFSVFDHAGYVYAKAHRDDDPT